MDDNSDKKRESCDESGATDTEELTESLGSSEMYFPWSFSDEEEEKGDGSECDRFNGERDDGMVYFEDNDGNERVVPKVVVIVVDILLKYTTGCGWNDIMT